MNKNGNLSKQVDYTGNYIYENGKLSFILTDKGRIVPDSSDFAYEYFIKEHLGNTRINVQDSAGTGIAAIQQESHYYPFGLQINALSYTNPLQRVANKYLYNGKELQDDFGLGWLDYGKRFYDAEVSRFTSIDPLAEKYSFMSPYQYAANNPVNFIDVNGDSIYINYTTRERRTGFLSKVFKYKNVEHTLTYTTDGTFNSDGSKYTGGNEFADNTIDALNSLNVAAASLVGDASEFSNTISFLASDKISKVRISQWGRLNARSWGGPVRGGVKWNPKFGSIGDKTYGKTYNILPAIILFHELGHKKMDTEAMYYGGDGKDQHKRLLIAEEGLAKFYKVGFRSNRETGDKGHYNALSPLSTKGKKKIYD